MSDHGAAFDKGVADARANVEQSGRRLAAKVAELSEKPADETKFWTDFKRRFLS